MVDPQKYWYSRLPLFGRRTYDSICSSLKRYKEQADAYTNDNELIEKCISAVTLDNPQYFWFNSRVGWTTTGGRNSVMTFNNIYDRRQISAASAEIKRVEKAVRGADELETEKNIVEYIVRRATYEINDRYNQNAASAIYFKRAQCSGITSAVKCLCDANGIWCIRVDGEMFGERSGPHSWNIVNIGGKYYHLDATSILGTNEDKPERLRLVSFNYSDEEAGVNHRWDRSSVPACPEKFKGGQSDGSGILIFTNLLEMRGGIEKAILGGEKSMTFLLKVGDDAHERMKLVMSGVKMVVQKLNISCGYQVSACGDDITITFN